MTVRLSKVNCIFFFVEGLNDFLCFEKLDEELLTDYASELVSELYTEGM